MKKYLNFKLFLRSINRHRQAVILQWILLLELVNVFCNVSQPAVHCPHQCTCETFNRLDQQSSGCDLSSSCLESCEDPSGGGGGVSSCEACHNSTACAGQQRRRTTVRVTCSRIGLIDVPREDIPVTTTSLDLSYNRLYRLQFGLFSLRMSRISELQMTNNDMVEIGNDAFQPLRALQTLNLSRNSLTQISSTAFAGLDSLQQLDLSFNRLSMLNGAFDQLENVIQLDLSGNNLVELTRTTFRGLVGLRHLLLADNKIVYVDRRAFRHLRKLLYLILKGNNELGTAVAHSGFHFHSDSLSYIDLSECGFSEVPRGLPQSARYLQLRRNNLTRLTARSFSECPHLYILVLDDNGIVDVENETFNEMSRLQQLWLNNNKIKQLQFSLGSSLERLLMDFNELTEVREIIPRTSLSLLTTLSLMGNRISQLAVSAFIHCPFLDTLQLSNNSLTELRTDTFVRLQQLRILDVSSNPLKTFHTGCFRGLEALEQISLGYISSTEIVFQSNVVGDVIHVKQLNLENSPGIVSMLFSSQFDPDVFPFLSDNERTISLSHSRARHRRNSGLASPYMKPIDDGIEDSSRIERFILLNIIGHNSDIRIKRIPQYLSHQARPNQHRRARQVTGSQNETLPMPDRSLILWNLTELNLRGSSITSIRADLPRLVPHLQTLHISSDQWNCDASVVTLRDWIASSAELFRESDSAGLKCMTPEKFQGRPISSLTDVELGLQNASIRKSVKVPAENIDLYSSTMSSSQSRNKFDPQGSSTTSTRPFPDDLETVSEQNNVSKKPSVAGSTVPTSIKELDATSVVPLNRILSTTTETSSARMSVSNTIDISSAQAGLTNATDSFLGYTGATSTVDTTTEQSSSSTTRAAESGLFSEGGRSSFEDPSQRFVINSSSRSKGDDPVSPQVDTSSHTFRNPSANISATDKHHASLTSSKNDQILFLIVIILLFTLAAVGLTVGIVMFLLKKRPAGKCIRTESSNMSQLLSQTPQNVELLSRKRWSKSLAAGFAEPRGGWGAAGEKEPVVKSKSAVEIVSWIKSDQSVQRPTVEVLALVPGRDLNHEGPLRVYNWEDF